MVNIENLKVGGLKTNCYIVWGGDADATVIDPGGDGDRIISFIEKNNLNVKAVLLTHGHIDHIADAGLIQEKFSAPLYIHANDSEMLHSKLNMAHLIGIQPPQIHADVLLRGGERIEIGDMTFDVIHTPGHSMGSVCYLIGDKIFCGDTLFFNSYGATHFYGGSMSELAASVKKIFALDGDRKLYCGHGRTTSLNYERANNPILQCLN